MSSHPAVRQMVAEQPLGQARESTLWAEGKPLVRWWPRLHTCARGILLAPQFPGQGNTAAWTWSESTRSGEVDANVLIAVRRRLRESALVLREEEGEKSPPLAVVEAYGRWMEELVARNDKELSRFVCVTLHGPMVHSWGARLAAVPRVDDEVDFEVAGTVLVMGKADAGHEVVLEDVRGLVMGKMRSDSTGRFRFPRIAPGRYRLRGVSERVDFPVTGLTVEVTTASVENLELKSSATVAGRASPGASPIDAVATVNETAVADPSPPAPAAATRKRGTATLVWAVVGCVGLSGLVLWQGWLRRGTLKQPELVSGSVNAPPDEVGGAREPASPPAPLGGDVDSHLPNARRPFGATRSQGIALSGAGQPERANDPKGIRGRDPLSNPEREAETAAVAPEGASFQSRQGSAALPQSSLPGFAAGHAPGSGSSLPGALSPGSGSPGGLPAAGSGRPAMPAAASGSAGLPAGFGPAGSVAARSIPSVGTAIASADAPAPAPAPPGADTALLPANPLQPEKPPELNPPANTVPTPQPEAPADAPPAAHVGVRVAPAFAKDTPAASETATDGLFGRDGSAVEDRTRSEGARPREDLAQGRPTEASSPEGSPRLPVAGTPGTVTRVVRIMMSPGQLQLVRDRIVETFPQPIRTSGGTTRRGRESSAVDSITRPADFEALVLWTGLSVKSPRLGAWVVASGSSGFSLHRQGNELGWRGTAPPGTAATWSSNHGSEVRLQIGQAGEWEVSYPPDLELDLWWATPRVDRSSRELASARGKAGTPFGRADALPLPMGASARHQWLRLETPSEPCLREDSLGDEGTIWLRASIPIGSVSSRGERMGLVDDVTGWAWVIPVQVSP